MRFSGVGRIAVLLSLLVLALLAGLRPEARHEARFLARSAPVAPAPARIAFAERVESSRDLRAFVERHVDRSDEPQVAYDISQALEECYAVAKAIPDRDGYRPASAVPTQTWAIQWARRAAEEALAAPCRGFEGVAVEPRQVLALLEHAASEGEPRARARMLLFRDVAAAKADVLDILPELLATGDPSVIRDVGAFLARGESHVVLGPAQVPAQVAVIAWELAVCDLGYDCGPASRLTLAQCVLGGSCGAGSYEDALAGTEDPQLFAQARAWRTGIVQALRLRDWEWLGLSGPRPG